MTDQRTVVQRVATLEPPKVEFHRHSLGPVEVAAVTRVLKGLFLTTGEETYAFEREFADFLGAPHVIGVSSCTAAEHLALKAFGIGPGDEVITTPMTFVATATAILHTGATPVLVDVEPDTGNLDATRVEEAVTPRTRAIVAVHLYGAMCDMRALRSIADRHGLVLIEDAAHCVEGRRDGVGPGQLGDAACFSFYATKTLTCGEGGAIAVHSDDVADRLRRLRLHGMTKNAADRYHSSAYQHYDVVELGFKCNLTNMQAAMLRPQLARLHAQRNRREEIAQAYDAVIDTIPGLGRPVVPAASRSARHLYTIWAGGGRDELLRRLGEGGVGCAVNYRALHQLEWVAANVELRFPLPEATRIGDQTLSLPIYDRLTDAEVQRVVDVLTAAVDVG